MTESPGHDEPRVVARTDIAADPGAAGAVWRLDAGTRDLDANLIQLPPGEGIGAHAGPALGVLLHVVAGSGRLTTATGAIELTRGDVVWLPPGSRRGFDAGPEGLRYLSVHARKPGLSIGMR